MTDRADDDPARQGSEPDDRERRDPRGGNGSGEGDVSQGTGDPFRYPATGASGDDEDTERDDSDDLGEPDTDLGPSTTSDHVADDEDPFAELDVPSDPDAAPGSVADPFDRMAVEEIDMDEVWDALDADTDRAPPASTRTPGTDDRRDDVVDKRTYCQRCPHFAKPPETACTLDGTDIVEVLGFSKFRVRGCPMVSEDGPGFDRTR